jgi:hypothetical protein
LTAKLLLCGVDYAMDGHHESLVVYSEKHAVRVVDDLSKGAGSVRSFAGDSETIGESLHAVDQPGEPAEPSVGGLP